MIPLGHTGEHRTIVTADLTVEFAGRQPARVLGTPWLIALLERTARQSLLPFLAEGEDSVGAHIDLRHLAPAASGARVTFRTRVTALDGRRVQFAVEALDAWERIAEGTHERVIIDVARFAQRVDAKR